MALSGGAAGGSRRLVRLERPDHRGLHRPAVDDADVGRHRRHGRSRGAGRPGVLQRLRQRDALAAMPLPAGPGGVRAVLRPGLSAGQRSLRRDGAAADRARRPDLGARLPPDPAGSRAEAPGGEEPHRLLPAHSWPARQLITTLPRHRQLVGGAVRLRPGRLPRPPNAWSRS